MKVYSAQMIKDHGVKVVSAFWKGGWPALDGEAFVYKFDERYFWINEEGAFDGPFDTLVDALGEEHLCFGAVETKITVNGLSAAEYAERMTVDAPAGHVVKINDETWAVDQEGKLVVVKPRKRRV